MKSKFLLCAGVLAALLFTATLPAYAQDCTTPNGYEPEIEYFVADNMYKFCNGTEWVALGSSVDNQPDNFSFTDQTGVSLSTLVTSNIVQITGMSDGTNISITGDGSPQYRICSDATCATNPSFTSAAGQINADQYVQLRLTSNGSASTMNSATITVGSVSDQWDVTTNNAITVYRIAVAAGGDGGTNIGGGGGGGEVYNDTVEAASGYSATVTTVGGGNTVAFGITLLKGGNGGSGSGGGGNGGSGGGGAGDNDGAGGPAGSATGSYSGNNGGDASGGTMRGGGGGGAGAAGGNHSSGNGDGGAGIVWINGLDYGSGGGGGARTEASRAGLGSGCGGNGGQGNSGGTNVPGGSGANRGCGGGGGSNWGSSNGGPGGAGVVVFAYLGTTVLASGGTITNDGTYTYHTFTSPGTFTRP